MVFALLKFQGFGIPHPFATQMFHHLAMFLRHPANGTQTATYLEAALQAHLVETRIPFGLLQQDFANTGILASETWLKRIWKILDDYRIFVALAGLTGPGPPGYRRQLADDLVY